MDDVILLQPLSSFTEPVPVRSLEIVHWFWMVGVGFKFLFSAVDALTGRYSPWLVAAGVPLPFVELANRALSVFFLGRLAGVAWLAFDRNARWLLALLVASAATELLIQKRYNTIFVTLVGSCLLLAPHLDSGAASTSVANSFAQWLLALIVVDIYVNSAWLKWRSDQFMSGQNLVDATEGARQRVATGAATPWLLPGAWLGQVFQRRPAAAPLAARATVAIELLLPGLLVWRTTWTAAVVLGVLLHLTFAALKPRLIGGFSLVTVGTYAAFLT